MSAPPSVIEPAPDSPLGAFTGDISPTKLSPLYTTGLAVVTIAMVLLPAVYVALIGLTAWGVIHYLTHGGWILEMGSGGALLRLLIYIGPPIAGGILVFFMLKPLFARRPKPAEPVVLDPAKEKLLFAFVEHICRLVRSPMPSRIAVDCKVNASAGLRRGLWSRDLVLTIGLPLAAGLDMRQFAGVLAHEFGHFAQGAGMRLTYVIRNINHWFARVVYERDKWDESLEESAKSVDLRLGVILHGARACVWLTRRILWVLMQAGNAISCFMLRQMEYDADSYESKVAGSAAFESTASRLRVLNVASQVAMEDVRLSWAGNQLPENLPLLIQHKSASLPADIHRKLQEAEARTKTGWLDTHPCDSDRILAARALNEPGVFRLERPATELFADFAATSRDVTRHEYEKQWELEFTEQNLVNSEDMLRESTASTQADAAVGKFYGEVNVSLVPLLAAGDSAPSLDREQARIEWNDSRERTGRLKEAAGKASAECVRQQQRLADAATALHLANAGFQLQPTVFGLPASAQSVSQQKAAASLAMESAAESIREETAKLNDFVAALRHRFTSALQLAQTAGSLSAELQAETEALTRTLAAVGSVLPTLRQVALRLQPFALLIQNRGNHSNPNAVTNGISRLADELQTLLKDVQSSLRDLPYPFPHPRGSVSVAEFAQHEGACPNDWEKIFRNGNAHLDRLFPLHYRLLGRLLVILDSAEATLDHHGPAMFETN